MGKRDFGHREAKKPPKDSKKAAPISIVSPPLDVEVIGKKRKKREEEAQ